MSLIMDVGATIDRYRELYPSYSDNIIKSIVDCYYDGVRDSISSFENRICANCRSMVGGEALGNGRITRRVCAKEVASREYNIFDVELDFGCNGFEEKE